MSVPKPDRDSKRTAQANEAASTYADRKSHAGNPPLLEVTGLTSWRSNAERKNSRSMEKKHFAATMQAKLLEAEQCQRDYAQLALRRNGFARGGKTPDAIKEKAAQYELNRCNDKLNRIMAELELIEQVMMNHATVELAISACLRHVSQLTRLQQNTFVQGALPWDVGAGQCAAFCYEYIHRRRAGAAPERILFLMRDAGVQSRMAATQAESHANNQRTRALEEAMLHHPRKDRLFVASLKHAFPRAAAYQLNSGYTFMEQILRAEHAYPVMVKSTSLRLLGDVNGVDFSLEALTMMWPTGRQMLPELKGYAAAGKAASVHASAMPSAGHHLRHLPRLPRGLAGLTAMHHATHGARPVVEHDLQHYLYTLRHLQHQILSNTAHPYFLLVIQCGPHGHEHLVGVNTTHAIVLDAGKEHCGIFDPNFGFLPLQFARRHIELPWLLALLFMQYDADKYSICILE